MKFYKLTVLVNPKPTKSELDIAREILAQVQTDGKETIVCMSNECSSHEVVKKTSTAQFPDCLTKNTGRVAFDISLPTQKDLGRKWFLKRLEGEEKKTYSLVAMTDVFVIHVEGR